MYLFLNFIHEKRDSLYVYVIIFNDLIHCRFVVTRGILYRQSGIYFCPVFNTWNSQVTLKVGLHILLLTVEKHSYSIVIPKL